MEGWHNHKKPTQYAGFFYFVFLPFVCMSYGADNPFYRHIAKKKADKRRLFNRNPFTAGTNFQCWKSMAKTWTSRRNPFEAGTNFQVFRAKSSTWRKVAIPLKQGLIFKKTLNGWKCRPSGCNPFEAGTNFQETLTKKAKLLPMLQSLWSRD